MSQTQVVLQHSPTLTRVETHRVVAVLTKAIERLDLLAMLDEQGPVAADGTMAKSRTRMATLSSAADDGGRGVGGILEEQKQLEARYEELIRATQKQRHNPMDPKLDAACFSHVRDHEEEARLEELRDVSKRLKEQSRLLCRQLKDNPNDAENWQKIVSERTELGVLLNSCVNQLEASTKLNDVHDAAAHGTHQLGSYEQFARKVLEEQIATQWAEELVKREKETNQNVKQLQNEVKQERALKEEELEQRHKEIAALKTELRELKQVVKEEMDRLTAETAAATEAQKREALDLQRGLSDQLKDFETMIRNEEAVSTDMKGHLEKKIVHLDEENAKWTSYSNEAQARMDTKKHNTQTERNELEQRLLDAKARLETERQQAIHREQQKNAELQLQQSKERKQNEEYRAATKLQAAIKACLTRAILAKGKKGKKKKK